MDHLVAATVDDRHARCAWHPPDEWQLPGLRVRHGTGESEQVVETFRRNLGIELIHVNAGWRFFDALAGITEPETKRKAIGSAAVGNVARRQFEKTAARAIQAHTRASGQRRQAKRDSR